MRHLAVFARWPDPGRVKTRLSPALPAALACDLHRALVADTLATAVAAEVDERALLWADAPGQADTPGGLAVPPAFRIERQVAGGLGARLADAFAARLLAPDDQAVIVGTDCPDLRPRHLAAAFQALADHDAVLGPTRDGGYYLIGMARPLPRLLEDIPWGTAEVLATTLARAAEAGARVAQLEPLADLDTPADLVERIAEWTLGPPAERPPATAHALGAMGLLPPAIPASD